MESLPNEIVIVRRRNSWDEEDHTHGVWKIAYADFMTALMAFFLVMWLINVTDESVRRGVAQYFNPVKLASTAPNRKGLNDPVVNGDTNENGTKLFTGKLGGSEEPADQDPKFGEGTDDGHKPTEIEELREQGGKPVEGQFNQTHSESILFTDPYAVLDTLSQKINVAETEEAFPKGIGSGLQKQQGALGGEAYRDPFDPQFWQFRPGRGVDGTATVTSGLPDDIGKGAGSAPTDLQNEGDKAWTAPFDDDGTTNADRSKTGTGPTDFAATDNGKGKTDAAEKVDPVVAHVSGKPGDKTVALKTGPVAHVSTEGKPSEDGSMASGNGSQSVSQSGIQPEEPATSQLLVELTEILEGAEGTVLEETAAQITVTRHDDAALISLTDDQNFGMFAIGSAEPRPELVKMLERLGGVIAKAPGQIVITGHTDARPFKSKTYDNWRLSSARAHMALYMLNRGGVGKDRFTRVEGAADRHLKNAEDPYAATNRRVEIYLLEEGAE